MQQLGTFIANHWELFTALVVILALIGLSFLGATLQGVKRVSPAEATGLINHQDALVLDIREDNEFTDGHILNSRHIPLSALANRLAEIEPAKERPIIVSCRSGSRSGTACTLLKKNGFQNVFNLSGGLLAWRNANLPVTKR